ncbi:MAG: GTP cyclohydrolase FolE2 [Bacillota bacterium]
MKDVQSLQDNRGIEIQRVGIKDIHLPFLIRTMDDGFQSVLANISLSVNLPKYFKGTHMSRFVEILTSWSEKPISGHEIRLILEETTRSLSASQAELSLRFRYFLKQTAPVSHQQAFLDYRTEFRARLSGKSYDYTLGVEVPVNSLCPCSKEISAYGAHNQRGVIRAQIRCHPRQYLWIEELVELLRNQGSAPIFPLLKREDEKFVTERAYENPKFVEDVLRDSVLALRSEQRITWFEIEVETFESIHNHSAFASHTEKKAPAAQPEQIL